LVNCLLKFCLCQMGEQKWVILAQILPHSFDKSRCIRRPDFVIAVERKGHVTYWKTSPTHSTL
jgi:hypothetical protein